MWMFEVTVGRIKEESPPHAILDGVMTRLLKETEGLI